MIDISFTGGSVVVSHPNASTYDTVITEFSDEGSPVEVDEIEVTGHSINMNGLLIRWRKASAYTVKVSVIPGSKNDEQLTKMLEAAHTRHNGGMVTVIPVSDLVTEMTIYAPSINGSGGDANGSGRMWKFSEGCIVGGNPGVGTDQEGKMSSKSYSFVFQNLDQPEGSVNLEAVFANG